MMRTRWLFAALLAACAGGLRAQARDTVSVTGRAVELEPRRSGPLVRGELLAVRPDSAWVLSSETRRIVVVPLAEFQSASVRRHGLTGTKGLVWGLIVGAVSGAGLMAACNSVEDTDCGAVAAGSLVTGLLFGGLGALSFSSSSRWRYRPISVDSLRRFARFPQGLQPAVMDSLIRSYSDSLAAAPTTSARP